MGRLVSVLVGALVVAGCQPTAQASATHDDAAVHVPTDREKRLAALDRLRASLGATERKRSPLEAPLELTNAYVAP